MKAFPTMEIGSLPKFSWRTKPLRGMPLDDADIENARDWGTKLGVSGTRELVKILSKRDGFSDKEKLRIVEFSLLFAIRMEETAGSSGDRGLDLIWSGEQARTELYETPVSGIAGFEFIGRVRSFDNKYWRMASVRAPPTYREDYHLDEFQFNKKHSTRRLKVPVTDAITIMAWSDNSYYSKKWAKKEVPPFKRSLNARRELTLELAKTIRQVIKDLIRNGAKEVQIDIPAATQYQSVEDIGLVTEAFNETVKGLSATFSMHSCFPPGVGYDILFPQILEMKCRRFSFEYANRDSLRKGVNADSRDGYKDLKLFKKYGYQGELGVGVIHVHTDVLPDVAIVKDRILYSAKVTGLPPEKLYISPDCGLRTRSPEIAMKCLDLVADGAALARREVGA